MAEKSKGWMSDESKREEKAGTKGSFSRAAKKAGMSTSAYAKKEASDPHASTKMKRKANMAKMFAKGRAAKRGKKRGHK
jgi:hypothetical protein